MSHGLLVQVAYFHERNRQPLRSRLFGPEGDSMWTGNK